MQSHSDEIIRVEENSYCPDYINRHKEKESIEDFKKRLDFNGIEDIFDYGK